MTSDTAGKNSMGVVAVILACMACLACVSAGAQASGEARQTKKEVRESRSRAKPLDIPVTADQPIYVKRFRADSVEVLGEAWPSEEAKKQEVERILDMIETQIRGRLMRRGFRCMLERDAAKPGAELEPNAVMIDGVLSKAGRGRDHPLADVTVTVTDARDPKKVYGKFSDGGIVGQITARISVRIAGPGENPEPVDTSAEFSRTR